MESTVLIHNLMEANKKLDILRLRISVNEWHREEEISKRDKTINELELSLSERQERINKLTGEMEKLKSVVKIAEQYTRDLEDGKFDQHQKFEIQRLKTELARFRLQAVNLQTALDVKNLAIENNDAMFKELEEDMKKLKGFMDQQVTGILSLKESFNLEMRSLQDDVKVVKDSVLDMGKNIESLSTVVSGMANVVKDMASEMKYVREENEEIRNLLKSADSSATGTPRSVRINADDNSLLYQGYSEAETTIDETHHRASSGRVASQKGSAEIKKKPSTQSKANVSKPKPLLTKRGAGPPSMKAQESVYSETESSSATQEVEGLPEIQRDIWKP